MSYEVVTQRDVRRLSKRLLWVVGILAAVIALALVGVPWLLTDVLGGGAPPDERLEQEVRALFEEAAPRETVTLSDATDFHWDAVGVFGPYYPHDSIVEDMGVAVPRSVTNWADYEQNCLLVFRAGDRVAGWTLVERSIAECSGDLSGRVYPLGEARFRGDAFAPPQ